jgi:hypothetical protein
MKAEEKNRAGSYRIMAAVVFGSGFAGLLFLLLKATIPTVIALLLSLLLFPGGILMAPFFPTEGIGSPLAVLVANALVYSIVAYAVIILRNMNAGTVGRATIRFVAPAAILFSLACIPALNPLWPHGMRELANQERELRAAFPLGTGLEQGRAILRSKGIEFREETASSREAVLERGDQRIVAAAGDQVLSAKFPTEADVFPCGYDMEILLLFDRDGKLKQQYVHRFPMCP